MLKKALLVGINAYRTSPLPGCVNDAKAMHALLRELCGFQAADMRLLLDREATSQGIKDGLAWLAQGGEAPATRVFFYAGHGHHVPDKDGDEGWSGRDEAIVPADYLENGYLIDDDLKTLYDRFPLNGNLILLMDCCHSGTNQREPGPDGEERLYRFLPNTYEEREAMAAARKKFDANRRQFIQAEMEKYRGGNVPFEKFEGIVGGLMKLFERRHFGYQQVKENNILLAACQDNQKATDARMPGGNFHGAFTYHLVQLLREAQGKMTYRDLVENLGKRLYAGKFDQKPQLACRVGREFAAVFS